MANCLNNYLIQTKTEYLHFSDLDYILVSKRSDDIGFTMI